MGGAGRVDSQAFGIANVCQVAEQLQPVYKAGSSLAAVLDAKSQDRSRTLGQVFLRRQVIGMALQPGVGNTFDPGMLLQEFGDSLGVAHMALHAQAERLDALQEQPGVERRLAGADIAQHLDPGFGDESGFTQVGIPMPW